MTKQKSSTPLALAALGVVFGDIGTSPLYALQATFGISGLAPDMATILGIVSLLIWSITLVVTIKYVLLMTRADNHGEGGIMALIATIRSLSLRRPWASALLLLGVVGICLFYGDSVITPAISVLSAVEGIKLFLPSLSRLIVPLSLVILLSLFVLQRKGSGTVGRLFGPVMALWFTVSAAAGLVQIIQTPAVLTALLPTTALHFALLHPLGAFIAMGSVILAITGAEALYADMGHFGRGPITRAWLWLVFPALLLTYLGQAALVGHSPTALGSAYFLLFPRALQLPVTLLAMAATLIASQAVIAGAFSITRQAIHLGLLPRMAIIHTSDGEAGQIYVPFLNWLLASLVAIVVISFGSSAHLAAAFGFAISGVLLIDTLLFLVIVRQAWRRSRLITSLLGLLLLPLDIIFVSSSSFKFLHGAWLSLTLGIISFALITSWYRGHRIILNERHHAEENLDIFVRELAAHPVRRIAGTAVYLGSHAGRAPLALRASLEQFKELHERILIVTVTTANVSHIPLHERVIADTLGSPHDGITHVTLRFGFKDRHAIPTTLAAADLPAEARPFDSDGALYFISDTKPTITHRHTMALWRKYLFVAMARNSTQPSDFYHLPAERSIEMTSLLPL